MKTDSRDPALRELATIWLRDSCGCAECRDAGSGLAVLRRSRAAGG